MASRERATEHREGMDDRGYRLIQRWVLDVRSERFAAEAHRQSAAVTAADRTTDDETFIESVSIPWNE